MARNQHEVELGDLQLGERIGFLDRFGEERTGIVEGVLPAPKRLGLFKVSTDGYTQVTSGEQIVWREII